MFVLYLSSFTLSENEYAVLTQFGKPAATITASGFHWKRTGFLETVNRIDRRMQTFTTLPIQLLLGDKNPIVLTCSVCWSVRSPLLFFQSLVTADVAVQKLGDMINSQLGSTLGDFTLNSIINTDPVKVALQDIETRILTATNESAQEKYGIEVVHVGIRRIAYPTIVADSVYNRMRSEREKEAMKIRAEGREEATKIKAGTDREVKELLAEAYKQSEILKGEGDRKALSIYAKAYGKDREFFEFIKSLEAYREIFNKQSTVILSTDSEIFKYLATPNHNKPMSFQETR